VATAARASVERSVRRVSFAMPRRSDESGAPIDHGGNPQFFGRGVGATRFPRSRREFSGARDFKPEGPKRREIQEPPFV